MKRFFDILGGLFLIVAPLIDWPALILGASYAWRAGA